MIYLDHAATTPLDPELGELMARTARDLPGNPSSIHAAGRAARRALEQARERLGGALGVAAERIIFTASGSEANNLALKGTVLARRGRPTHLVVSAIEHPCARNAARWLAATLDWVSLSEVAPGEDGAVAPEAVAAALRPETCLVALMAVNHETGVIQPVAEVAALARAHGAPMHCDAVQGLGRIDLAPVAAAADMLALAGHKIHGPRGAAALVLAPGTEPTALIHGGNQERIVRAGTENLPAIVALARAAELAVAGRAAHGAHLAELERVFLATLQEAGPGFMLNGDPQRRAPGILNLAVRGAPRDDLVVGLDLAGVAISAGAACSSGVIEPSHVLAAMGLEPWRAEGGVRISFGRGNTAAEARAAAAALARLARRLA